MTFTRNRLSRRQIILDTWKRIGLDSAGAEEFKVIQQELRKSLGPGGVESPASLARVLADEGIKLRHPEVLESDSNWRERRLYELFGPGELQFETIAFAMESAAKIEDLFEELEAEDDQEGIKNLVALVRELKVDLKQRPSEIADEIVEWLTVWLQNPGIFKDWLSLRVNSPVFLKTFPNVL
jgi:hypothetical protein